MRFVNDEYALLSRGKVAQSPRVGSHEAHEAYVLAEQARLARSLRRQASRRSRIRLALARVARAIADGLEGEVHAQHYRQR